MFRQSLGPAPLSQKDQEAWEEKVLKMEKVAVEINKRIEKFNLFLTDFMFFFMYAQKPTSCI